LTLKPDHWLALTFAAVLALQGCAGGAPPREAATPAFDTQSTVRLARAARAAGDLASAVNLYRTIVAATPDAALKVELGDTLLDAGSIDDAIAVFQGVPAKTQAALGAALGLERAYLALGALPKAMAAADRAHAIAPEDRRVLVDRGIALDIAGRHDEAQSSYRAVLAKAPHDRAARVDLALSLTIAGRYAEAIDILTPIALSSTATARERQNLALAYGLKGDDTEAKTLSRLDLDAAQTAANLRFFALVRDAR
jgi:Flp pilus assembly protein TadD